MFSERTTPISTMVPMAMAMPERATIFASTAKILMAMKHISTARGSSPEMSAALRKWATITRMTATVTRISSSRALSRVPRVSWMSPVRS